MKSRSLAEFNEEKMQMRKLTKLHDNSMKKLCYKREERNAGIFQKKQGFFFFNRWKNLISKCSMSMSIINGK